MSYDGYGINLDSSARFKKNAAVLFMDKWYLATEYGQDAYKTYCEDSDLTPNDDESKEAFVESYENDTYCWSGLEGLLVDYINDYECDHEVVFRFEDYCIVVMAGIPENEEQKKRMLTQEDIAKILQKYLPVLLEENSALVIRWYTIND